jgi:hypothetical protein
MLECRNREIQTTHYERIIRPHQFRTSEVDRSISGSGSSKLNDGIAVPELRVAGDPTAAVTEVDILNLSAGSKMLLKVDLYRFWIKLSHNKHNLQRG